MVNMIETVSKISKNIDSKEISKMILDTEMDERIENIQDESTKYLIKSIVFCTRTLADKGLKSKAHMLAQEFFSQEDLDGDGKIYGIDFVYENPPIVIQKISEDNIKEVPEVLTWYPIR